MGYFKKKVANVGTKTYSMECKSALTDFLGPLLREMNMDTFSTGATEQFSVTFLNSGSDVNITINAFTSGRVCMGCKSDSIAYISSYGCTRYDIDSPNDPLVCHAVLSKHKNILSVGVSVSDTSPPFLTETLVKYGDKPNDFFIIQHGTYLSGLTTPLTYDRDVYVNTSGEYKMTQPQISLGYRTNDFIAMVPAINPWTNDVIPDLYLSVMHPKDQTPIRQQIMIGNRTFISGLLTVGSDIDTPPLTYIEI